MAILSGIMSPTTPAPLQFTVGAAVSSAEQVLPAKSYVICATDDCFIRWGLTGVGAADATFWRIPRNQPETFESTQDITVIRIFNNTAATITVTVLALNRC